MVQIILQELLHAIGRFFINPLLYVAILFAIFLGYFRVKRERKFFHIRIVNGWSEFKSVFKIGWVASILLSVITIAAGLTLPIELLIFVSVITIVTIILFNFHFLSAVVTWAVSYCILIWMHAQNITIELFGYTVTGLEFESSAIKAVAIVIGLLLILEGWLISKDGAHYASPIVEKTKRGLKSIAYFSKKIWIIPVFFIVPSNVIEGYLPWWPFLPLGSEQFALVLFPVVIGFQQVTRRLLPSQFYRKLGRNVRILGEVVVLGGMVSYFDYRIAYGTVLVAIIVRFALSFGYKLKERNDLYAVAPSNDGVVIAAVLPGSPAEKMGLRVGDVIKRVNGQYVSSERELYEALQINAAHCKLEVLDEQREIRLTQYVVHNNDHHQIGLLLVQ